jgi:hypothetical protein
MTNARAAVEAYSAERMVDALRNEKARRAAQTV